MLSIGSEDNLWGSCATLPSPDLNHEEAGYANVLSCTVCGPPATCPSRKHKFGELERRGKGFRGVVGRGEKLQSNKGTNAISAACCSAGEAPLLVFLRYLCTLKGHPEKHSALRLALLQERRKRYPTSDLVA